MDLIKLRTQDEFRKYNRTYSNKRIQFEQRIIKEHEEEGLDFLLGYCKTCDKASKFKIVLNKHDKRIFRGSLVCEFCKLPTRKRFMLSFLQEFPKKSDSPLDVFMYEQVTDFFNSAQKIKNINCIGSEFLGYDKKPGQIIKNIRNEDGMNLSFENNSFDVLVSNDVFEHLPNINKALSEAYRVLKNSGSLLISIPFHAKTTRRATMEEGKIQHLQQPIYHDNPIAKKEGSLVFYEYGWDFLDFVKTAGFHDVYMLIYYDYFYGYLGMDTYIFVAEK